jgi:hypothetical protein
LLDAGPVFALIAEEGAVVVVQLRVVGLVIQGGAEVIARLFRLVQAHVQKRVSSVRGCIVRVLIQGLAQLGVGTLEIARLHVLGPELGIELGGLRGRGGVARLLATGAPSGQQHRQ